MTLQEFITKFNVKLNKQQLEAVQSVEKPTLLLAVPGSGKTTVLVTRLGYMIYCLGIRPEEILTVTYTVAATNDMRKRFASIFGDELAARLEFRTINGICAKIIGYCEICVGKKAFDLLTDEGYKTKLLSAIYTELVHQYPTESDLKNISTLITYIKNMQLSKEEIDKVGNEQDIPLLKIYSAYCDEMKKQSLMDYDDQMVYALTMLKVSPQILEYFQDCGMFQSEELGLGVEEDQKNHRAWYLIAWNVKIIRHPKMSEHITVTTQAYKMRGFYGYRRYSILDEEGEAIVLAEAIWILMDTKKMLPMKVSKEIADIYVEKDADTTVRINRKIDDNGEWKQQESIEVTKQYLDSNNHVNNTVYALWSEDVLSENVNVKEVRIDYRKAAMFKETIQVFTQQQENIFKVKYIKPDGEVAALVEMILQKQEEK